MKNWHKESKKVDVENVLQELYAFYDSLKLN